MKIGPVSDRALLCACASSIALAPMTMAHAQTESNVNANASSQLSGDIVVTARKRAENLLQVPVAITALNADALAARGIKDLNGLNDFSPGLRYENSSVNRNDRSFYTITMRGMFPGDSPNRPGVGVFEDGVPLPGGALPGLSDVERVEVIKGPQSAYFGRATFAGAINFITKAPSLTDYSGKATVSYESYGGTDDSLSLEGPIVRDKLALRVTGRFYHTDGQYQNQGYGGRLGERETKAITASLIAKPVDDLTIRGYFTMWHDSDGPSAQATLTEQDFNCNVGGTAPASTLNGYNYYCGGLGSAPAARMAQATVANGRTDFSFLNAGNILPRSFIDHMGMERKEYQAHVTASYDLGDYTIAGSLGKNRNRYAAITSTYNRPPDGTGFYANIFLPYDINNESGELRISNNGNSRLRAMLGGNYYHESIKFEGVDYTPIAGNPTVLQILQPTNYMSTTYGIFGSLGFDITDKLTLSAEARYQWDKVHHEVMIPGGFNMAKTFKSFSPRVILNYKLSPLSSVYASYAKGTRPGVFNSAYAGQSPTVKAAIDASAAAQGLTVPIAVPEETLKSWEVGYKGELFDRRVRFLIDGYYSEWRGRQINQNISYLIGSVTQSTTIVFSNGKTNLWGVEAETTVKINRDLTFDGTFDWAHTKVLYNACAECAAVNGVLNPYGNSMERYPEFSGTASLSYSHPINENWRGFSRLDYIYTGKQYATEANVAWVDPANRFNLTIGAETDRYRIELYGRNIFNDKTPTNLLRSARSTTIPTQPGNVIILTPPEKATFGIRASVKF